MNFISQFMNRKLSVDIDPKQYEHKQEVLKNIQEYDVKQIKRKSKIDRAVLQFQLQRITNRPHVYPSCYRDEHSRIMREIRSFPKKCLKYTHGNRNRFSPNFVQTLLSGLETIIYWNRFKKFGHGIDMISYSDQEYADAFDRIVEEKNKHVIRNVDLLKALNFGFLAIGCITGLIHIMSDRSFVGSQLLTVVGASNLFYLYV